MAEILEKFGAANSFTLTSANLASSPTAGWMSAAVDNSADKFLDSIVNARFAAVNTAPAGSKAIFIAGYGLVDTAGSAYTSTGDGTPSGSVGTITFPDITTLSIVCSRMIAIPYSVQNKAINSGPISMAALFGGFLPIKWGVLMLNHSGMTLNVTAIEWQGLTKTVA